MKTEGKRDISFSALMEATSFEKLQAARARNARTWRQIRRDAKMDFLLSVRLRLHKTISEHLARKRYAQLPL